VEATMMIRAALALPQTQALIVARCTVMGGHDGSRLPWQHTRAMRTRDVVAVGSRPTLEEAATRLCDGCTARSDSWLSRPEQAGP
jgi:hypothetical protein